jgi:DHA2 family multidrug resistance protein
MMPGALASAVTMMAMGKISGRMDARLLIAAGALITVSAALLLSRINPNTGTQTLFLPLILRGVGSVCMFLPLSLATLGSLPKNKVAAGSGFYNLTRQLGSSIGIAIITTLLAHREAVHRATLVERVNPFSPETQSRLQLFAGAFSHRSGDPVAAHQQAFKALDGIVNGQAALLSFAEIFIYVGVAFVASLPLLFLLGKGGNKSVAAAAH